MPWSSIDRSHIPTSTTPTVWIDVSVPIHDSMTGFPGYPLVSVMKFEDMHKGDETNVSLISMTTHTGTHIDTPRHIFKNGNDINSLTFEAIIGPCRVVEIRNRTSIRPEDLEPLEIKTQEKILFKTRNSELDWTTKNFKKDFVALSPSAAEFLAEKKIQTVGIDYLCIGSPSNKRVVQGILSEASIWIIEGLNLSRVQSGNYFLNCLPLSLLEAEAAPARAVLKSLC